MDKIKLGILGLNYDTEAGRGWPGARYAPDSIRRALSGIMNRVEDGYLFDVCNNKLINLNQFEIKDFGNTDQICHYSHVQALKEMSECIQKVISSGFIPILLGGDHSVTNAGFDALYQATKGKIGIIDFDAHLDLKFDSPVQGKYSGSSEIRRAVERERISAKNVVEIGPRGFNYPEHYHFIKESGITIFSPKEVYEKGAKEIARKALEIAGNGTEAIYVTVDIDSLDMAYALGSGGQEPAGLNHFQLAEMIRIIAPKTAVIDYVEVNPMTDHRELTSHVCANLILEFIAGICESFNAE
ncbi:MAG: arginase family protein [Clostridia bacterium]